MIVEARCAEEIYVADPSPWTVEVRDIVSVDVDTWPSKLAAEIYPTVPRPATVDVIFN